MIRKYSLFRGWLLYGFKYCLCPILRVSPETYCIASFRESDRKKIHAKLTKLNVSNISGKYFNSGVSLFVDSFRKSGLFVPRRKKGIYKTAWIHPQIRKVQFAPCQNPLSKNMMKIFRIALDLPFLEPPNGM